MRKQFISGAIAVLALSAVAIPATASADGGHGHTRKVRMQDNCDPATFDAAIGPGTCLPHGHGRTVTFDEFLSKLNPMDFGHPEWRFKPDMMNIKTGDSLDVTIRGGEFHTFTEVDMFGPGCVDFINGALGLSGAPAADCALLGPTGVLPGGHLMVSGLSAGEHKFMCLIHPWMRTTVEVRAHDD